MKKKYLSFVFLSAICITLLITHNAKADSLQSTRLGGLDRYETNIKVIQQGWQKSDYAIVVGGQNFPDALSATPLAKKYNAPIFFGYVSEIDSLMGEFDRLGVKKVFIIGGPQIISTSVEGTLKNNGISYERIYGKDRYQTSIDIANNVGTKNGVIVATGTDYPDALSIAPVAGKLQMPIILSRQDVLDSIQKKFISTNAIPKTYVVGGTDTISNNVSSKFPKVQRIATEDNRYARNLDIINTFANNIDFSTAILASGADFPDALSGSALGALNGNPIILTGKHEGWQNTEYADKSRIETLLGNKNTKNIYALGLEGSISDEDLNDIVNSTDALNTIKSKVILSSNLNLAVNYDKYSYDGSTYYRISLQEERNGLKLHGFYPYDFLVDTETGDTYKIDIDTKEITPLDTIKIDSNNVKQKAVELIADKITEKDSNTEIQYCGIEDINNKKYHYIQAYDNLYDRISTVGFYYIDVNTNIVYQKDINDVLKPIN